MPVCNMCGESFDVEIEPGALMFGHPETVKEAVPVWKAHICQSCETYIEKMFKIKPKKFKIIDDNKGFLRKIVGLITKDLNSTLNSNRGPGR